MMVLHSFLTENIEYLICSNGLAAVSEKAALLCSRTEGVGADKVLCYADHAWHVFLADGSEAVLTAKEQEICTAFYLTQELPAEMMSAEIHLTSAFCRKLGLVAQKVQMAG